MTSPILFGFLQYIFGPLLLLTSVFLILVVLVQRGRGGGLTGALGGAGGQSAFGAKAGDMFTRITVVVAVFWILLCIFATMGLQDSGASKLTGSGSGAATGLPGDTLPGDGGPSLTLPSDEKTPPDTAAPAAGDAAPADLEPPAEGGADAAAPAADAAPADSAPTETAAPEAPATEEKPAE
ncbi:preprotein translocase subunit SecG [Blastopirellula marina]|uniref:Protein-export membrane protein SecG n=1 Tax=Blastopirellula marina TaxID=124 RepID=A0A2S8F6C5_9BACT|nr:MULTISPECIES: preprotein translocase subunit SecG [Pirellulaceae]PQO27484.1 preprotein translocase subunit SecG [Blastopirellula marina]RCS48021.1 preprotein translocase subunit SecG [Bremerella cremea]